MGLQKGNILIIGLFVGLILAGAGGFYFLNSQKLNPDSINLKKSVTQTAQTSKTYSNLKYNFSVEYPEGWGLVEYEPTGSLPGFKPLNDIDYQQPYYSVASFREGCLESMMKGKDFEEWVKKDAAQEVQGYKDLKAFEIITTKSGVKIYKIIWNTVTPGGGGGSSPVGYIKLEKGVDGYNCLEIEYGDEKYRSEVERIILSFKFLDKN